MSWARSPVGPDWMDIRGGIAAHQETHECTTWLDMSLDGSSLGTSWRISLISVWPGVRDKKSRNRWASQVCWPNPDSSEIEGAILKLLYEHDFAVTREKERGEVPAGA
jgi:hypothetical protein